VHDPELAGLFLHAHVRAERSGDELERESLVLSVLLAVIQRHATEARRVNHDGHRTPGVTRAVDLMQSCYARRLTLADLAQAAGTGRYAIIRAFQRQIGMSPYAYLTQVRVERARALLQGGTSVAAAARRVGFSDQSHLTRKFKRFVGITPAAFARGARETPRS
jgi:AraC-like DNA-binding protein